MIFFSVNKAGTLKDLINHRYIKSLLTLHKIYFVEVLGVYKGIKEASLLVSSKHLAQVKRIASQYDQESILIVDDKTKSATLHFLNTGKKESLGTLKAIDKVDGKNSYSMINGKFFICE